MGFERGQLWLFHELTPIFLRSALLYNRHCIGRQVCKSTEKLGKSWTQVFLLERHFQEIAQDRTRRVKRLWRAKSLFLEQELPGIMSGSGKALQCPPKAGSGLGLPAEASAAAPVLTLSLCIQMYIFVHTLRACPVHLLTANFIWKKKITFLLKYAIVQIITNAFFSQRPDFPLTYAQAGWKILLHSQGITAQHPVTGQG